MPEPRESPDNEGEGFVSSEEDIPQYRTREPNESVDDIARHDAPRRGVTWGLTRTGAIRPWRQAEQILYYQSLSVNRRVDDGEPARGSLRIVEEDRGEHHDFYNIHVDLVWTPRGSAPVKPKPRNEDGICASEGPAAKERGEARVSVDDILTMRMSLLGKEPTLTFHLRGAVPWGTLIFPNGPDAAWEFVRTLERHVNKFPLADPYGSGRLFYFESRPRMRRVGHSISDSNADLDSILSSESQENISISSFLSSTPRRNDPLRHRIHARDQRSSSSGNLPIGFLEQFARITQATRDLGGLIAQVLDGGRAGSQQARERALNINAEIVASSTDEQKLPPFFKTERSRGVPVKKDIWYRSLDDAGRLKEPIVMKQAIFSGGVEPSLRSDVWPLLLDVFPWASTRAEREDIALQRHTEYSSLRQEWEELREEARSAGAVPVSSEDDEPQSVEPQPLARVAELSKRHDDYLRSEDQIEKDILRTDRKIDLYERDNSDASRLMGDILNIYAENDAEIRYCQGMSDFLSPILYHVGLEHEGLVFWCFKSLMKRIERNFRIDQTGIHAQLKELRELVGKADPELAEAFRSADPEFYTCFRWILVQFKRELRYEDTARLWEVFWTRHVAHDNLHIYIAAALLIAHRRQILSLPRGEFDSLLRYINDMNMRIDVDFALREGELCYRKYAAQNAALS